MAELTEALENSDVAFAVRYNKVSVKNFESFRRALPADAKLYVAKNTLMKQAVSRVSHSISLAQQYHHVQLRYGISILPQDAAPSVADACPSSQNLSPEPFCSEMASYTEGVLAS